MESDEGCRFPFVVPGYGLIGNRMAWEVFCQDYRNLGEAHVRLQRKVQSMEIESQMRDALDGVFQR